MNSKKRARALIPIPALILAGLFLTLFPTRPTPTPPPAQLTPTHQAFATSTNNTAITPSCDTPITYAIHTENMPPGHDTVIDQTLTELATLTPYTFAPAPPNTAATVQLHWNTPTSSQFKNTTLLGTTNSDVNLKNGTFKQARVHFNTTVTNPYQFKALALHELGHVLGMGHSMTPTDLMYPRVADQTGYTNNDLAALTAVTKSCATAQ